MYNDAPEAGLASLLSSRGRGGDSVLVHMAPQELAGLQRLAMAHGGSLTRNPETGLYEASFLKKILPQVIGAILPSVPGVGQFTKTIGFGNEALGSALIVGGATGLIEGDLKKGLMAGLGAYSGASIAGGLRAAAGVGAPAGAEAETPTSQVSTGAAGKTIAPPSVKDQILYGGAAPRGFDVDSARAANWAASNTPTGAAPIQAATTVKPPTSFLGTMGQGVKNIFTTPEGGSKFMEGLGGGYKSPIGQTLSRYATFAGATLPFTEEPVAFPAGGAGGDEIVYIPAQYDPTKSSVFQAQGQYYRRTPQGLVPYNPFQMAPKGRGFATGGPVQPADQDMNQPRSVPHQNAVVPYPNHSYPLSTVTGTPYPNMPLGSNPQPKEIVGNYEPEVDAFTGEQRFADGGLIGGPILVSGYNAPTEDPNVLATRAYIEELNRRARFPYGMQSGTGMGGTGGVGGLGPQGLPAVTGGGTAGGGGGGSSAGGAGVGDIVGGIAANYLINKGIQGGVGYLRDKFFPSADQLKEVQVTGKRVPEPTTGQTTTQPTGTTPARTTSSSSVPYTTGTLAALNAISPFMDISPLPATKTTVEPVSYEGEDIVVREDPTVPRSASSSVPYTTGSLAALNAFSPFTGASTLPATRTSIEPLSYEGEEIVVREDPTKLDADLQARTKVGGNLSRPLSSYFSGASGLSGLAGLANAGKAASIAIELPIYDALGNLIGFSSSAPGAASALGSAATGASGAASGAGAAGTQTAGAGAGAGAGTNTFTGKVIPGLQAALGLYETYKGIEQGKEGRAALGAYGASAGLGSLMGFAGAGPIGLAAAAIAAIGASMVNTKEFGDVALRNYWNAVDAGRGIGQTNPTELAQGFINFYRTNKNEFAGQEKYGRTGNEEFVYDMTQVINNAVKNGQIDKNVDPATMYKQVVEPWLNSMGSGPQNEEAKKIQDFMMTDLINSFMQGKPISNAQVKNDSKFKIVSEKPVYAGEAPPTPPPQEVTNIPPAINPFGEDVARLIGDRFGDVAQIRAEEPAYERAMPTREEAVINPYAASPVTSVLPEQAPVGPSPLQEMAYALPYDPMKDIVVERELPMPPEFDKEGFRVGPDSGGSRMYDPTRPFAPELMQETAYAAPPELMGRISQEYDRPRNPLESMPPQAELEQTSPPLPPPELIPLEESPFGPRDSGPRMERWSDGTYHFMPEESGQRTDPSALPDYYRRLTEEALANKPPQLLRPEEPVGNLIPVPEEPYYAPALNEPTVAYEDPAYYQQYLARFEEEQRQAERQAALEAAQAARYAPEPSYADFYNPYADYGVYMPEELYSRFAAGGAIGDDYNFGFAHGGMSEYKAGGKLLNGPGDGMSDDIPAVIRGKGVQRAALADGEFVIPADVVSHLGNGSTKAGAKKLYDMMAKVRKARTGKTSQAPAVKTDRLLPA